MRAGQSQRGVTLIEILAALTIGAMVLMIAVPAFRGMLDRSRLDTATHRLTNELWSARSKAITTGWEYKLMGFGSTSSNARRNQYRLVGRSSSAIAWPADTASFFTSATQSVGPWIDLTTLNEGVQCLPGGSGANARFEIAFDARGSVSVNTGDFNPFQLQGKTSVKAIWVSMLGGVTTG